MPATDLHDVAQRVPLALQPTSAACAVGAPLVEGMPSAIPPEARIQCGFGPMAVGDAGSRSVAQPAAGRRPDARHTGRTSVGSTPPPTAEFREGSEKVPSKHCSAAYTSRANTHQRRCVSAAEGVCSRALIGVQESVCSPSSRPPTPSPEPTAMRYEWLVERGTPEKKKRPKL